MLHTTTASRFGTSLDHRVRLDREPAGGTLENDERNKVSGGGRPVPQGVVRHVVSVITLFQVLGDEGRGQSRSPTGSPSPCRIRSSRVDTPGDHLHSVTTLLPLKREREVHFVSRPGRGRKRVVVTVLSTPRDDVTTCNSFIV